MPSKHWVDRLDPQLGGRLGSVFKAKMFSEFNQDHFSASKSGADEQLKSRPEGQPRSVQAEDGSRS